MIVYENVSRVALKMLYTKSVLTTAEFLLSLGTLTDDGDDWLQFNSWLAGSLTCLLLFNAPQ